MSNLIIGLGALSAFISVAAGAFGAHALSNYFADKADLKANFETAVRYQMVHGLAILIVAWFVTRFGGNLVSTSGWLFLLGIIFFSGSLYIMSLTDLRWLGAVTPIGGVAFLTGWLLLVIAAWRQ